MGRKQICILIAKQTYDFSFVNLTTASSFTFCHYYFDDIAYFKHF